MLSRVACEGRTEWSGWSLGEICMYGFVELVSFLSDAGRLASLYKRHCFTDGEKVMHTLYKKCNMLHTHILLTD